MRLMTNRGFLRIEYTSKLIVIVQSDEPATEPEIISFSLSIDALRPYLFALWSLVLRVSQLDWRLRREKRDGLLLLLGER